MTEHHANLSTLGHADRRKSSKGGPPVSLLLIASRSSCIFVRETCLSGRQEKKQQRRPSRAHMFLPGLAESYLARQEFPVTTELAVLFVDIADSTWTLCRQPPAQALSWLQHFTELVTEIALAHCGVKIES